MKLKDLIFEVGESSENSYDIEKTYENSGVNGFVVEYFFDTLENEYIITFDAREIRKERSNKKIKLYEVDVRFSTDGDDVDYMTGEGDAIRVINTVIKAIKQFYKEYGPSIQRFKLEGIVKSGEDVELGESTQRARIYKRFCERQFPDARVELRGKTVYIYPKS